MARKLRLNINDWVMHRESKTAGRVFDVSWHKPEDYAKWGIFKYKIAWINDQFGLGVADWCIRDITLGHIVFIGNGQSIRVLYGKV